MVRIMMVVHHRRYPEGSARSAANEKHNPEPEHLLPCSIPLSSRKKNTARWRLEVYVRFRTNVASHFPLSASLLDNYSTHGKRTFGGTFLFYRKKKHKRQPVRTHTPPGSVSMRICILSSNTSLI
uniref:Uncharacterized protein n=1 Tax=Anopheles merus TaxID=30066 RepID=A0A1Y9IRA7_ANOME